jgi:hydrogenase maturation protease
MNGLAKTLIFGYGNPGRQDDGLGPYLTDELQKWITGNGVENIDFDSNYQLNIEDADTISRYDIVIFIDASTEDIEHFVITQVKPDDKAGFNTHFVSAGFVLDLCRKMYQKSPSVYLIHVKGYEYEIGEGLSAKAKANAEIVFNLMVNLLAVPNNFKNIHFECH